MPGQEGITAVRAHLVGWSLVALVVFRCVDSGIHHALMLHASALAVVPDLRLTSLALLVAGYVMTPPRLRLALWSPATWRPDSRTWRLVVVWLAGVTLVVHVVGIGAIPLPRWQDRVAFHVTGLFAEEVICRGLVLASAAVLWPRGAGAIVWSAAVFAGMHLQYHGFRLTSLALAQLVWTFGAGIVFGVVAIRTRSLAVSATMHFANNLLVTGL